MMSFLASRRRWLIVVMLAAFSVVNYIDRQALSVLAPTLRKDLGISTEQYSYIVSTFLAAYAIGYAIAGRTIDRVGVKATTNEEMGFIGRGEGIASLAVSSVMLPD